MRVEKDWLADRVIERGDDEDMIAALRQVILNEERLSKALEAAEKTTKRADYETLIMSALSAAVLMTIAEMLKSTSLAPSGSWAEKRPGGPVFFCTQRSERRCDPRGHRSSRKRCRRGNSRDTLESLS